MRKEGIMTTLTLRETANRTILEGAAPEETAHQHGERNRMMMWLEKGTVAEAHLAAVTAIAPYPVRAASVVKSGKRLGTSRDQEAWTIKSSV